MFHCISDDITIEPLQQQNQQAANDASEENKNDPTEGNQNNAPEENQNDASEEDKNDGSEIPETENKCDYVQGKLVAGPNVSHGLNNSGWIHRIFYTTKIVSKSEHILKTLL